MPIEAPERIWITQEDVGLSWPGAFKVFRASDLEHPDCPEYVRADKLEELAAELIQSRNYWSEEVSKAEAALAEKDKEIAALREVLDYYAGSSCGDGGDLAREVLARNAGGNNGE